MSIDLKELTEAGILTEEKAEQIREFYRRKPSGSSHILYLVFGILGAILVGLGIVLILAQNWSDFSRPLKTAMAFAPLLAGQACCAVVLMIPKLKESITWRESSATFLFFAVGACLALISHIYHISGSTESYWLTWMLLCLPMAYLMPSAMSALMYIVGITVYGLEADYDQLGQSPHHWYWWLLALIAPAYIYLVRRHSQSYFTMLFHWAMPVSVILMLASLQAEDNWRLSTMTYALVFGLFYQSGKLPLFRAAHPLFKSYTIVGCIGTLTMCYIGSNRDFWSLWEKQTYAGLLAAGWPLVLALVVLAGIIGYSTFRNRSANGLRIDGVEAGFAVFCLSGWLSIASSGLAALLCNLYLLIVGLQWIVKGARKMHLMELNLGLLLIILLIVARFFDLDLSFALRGVVFLLLGIIFFAANYWMLQHRKRNE